MDKPKVIDIRNVQGTGTTVSVDGGVTIEMSLPDGESVVLKLHGRLEPMARELERCRPRLRCRVAPLHTIVGDTLVYGE